MNTKTAPVHDSENLPIKILIIDDDEEDFFLTSQYIKKIRGKEFIIDWCYRYKEAYEAILEGKYDIYFIDYYLGAKTGLDLMKEALQQQLRTASDPANRHGQPEN